MTVSPAFKPTLGDGSRSGLLLRAVAPLFLLVLLATVPPPAVVVAADEPAHRAGAILVTPGGPDDGGEFGGNTPGTKTAGIAEAIAAAKATRRDVYIAGGAMPGAFKNGAVYNLQETLRIPWMQDFRLDSGEAVLQYTGKTGDAIVIDSQMSCRYKFGLVASPSGGAVVRLQPETKGPDNFSVITTSVFEFNAIVGGGAVFPDTGMKNKGTGLLLDGSKGSIDSNEITVTETIACETGVLLRHATNCAFNLPLIHLCDTHLVLGDPGTTVVNNNRVTASIDSQGIGGASGAVIHGDDNLLTLTVLNAAPGRALVWGAGARSNRVTAPVLTGGINAVTNEAEIPDNRLVMLAPVGFSLATPPVPESGKPLVNRTSLTVTALILDPGQVTRWTLRDANGEAQPFAAALTAGQSITLEPGDSVEFTYDRAPVWRWRGLRD